MQWFRRDADFMFVAVPSTTDKAERVQCVTDEILRMIALPRDEFDKERLDPNAESALPRTRNAHQAKGMKVYQLEKQRLRPGTQELRNAITEADKCTHRFQAKRPRYSPTHHHGSTTDMP